ncbi:MAG: 50S ribosomal protein L18 [Bacteroidales bacterium]|jgi:large subunit ribosomal protein L18|nr:50S ribosomal protein L18 [Bacteroidales bacterium]
MALAKNQRRERIKRRIRKKVYGATGTPRMSVFRSNKGIYVQIINDDEGKTLVSASSLDKEIADNKGITKCEQARLVGTKAAKVALEAGITEVVFDRNGCLYHGRVKELADAARKGGLKF